MFTLYRFGSSIFLRRLEVSLMIAAKRADQTETETRFI